MEDYPIETCPDIPTWSENYCLAGYDAKANINLYLHMARWRKDLSIWREIIVIALPDGTVVGRRAFGNALASSKAPGSAGMKLDIIEPGRRQRWSFLGGARRVAGESLRYGLLGDGPVDRLEFSFDFSSTLPVWDIASSGRSSGVVGHGHIEQIGRTTGSIRINDETFEFDCLANRDHSRGPRNMTGVFSHLWMHGVFGDGRCFQAYDMQQGSSHNTVMSEAAVFADGVMHVAELEVGYRLPEKDSIAGIQEPIPFSLKYGGQVMRGVTTAYPLQMFGQFTAPYDTYIGMENDDKFSNNFLIHQAALFELDDGSTGSGYIERTVPGKLIVEPN